ncbi:hypothetical protein Tdes44962_MAKER10017 [Teratosphaeria destructans]|uniref:Uncharacterized protein n=1 Tax=Teratosphaeria destructans TaxID=418781 RepID=A0A9W7SQA7_9PEZI|nr:hypothetical protein Tdes44962_MAKER10017 [Teratosphaeria destructans]
MFLCAVSKTERAEVTLQVCIAPDRPVVRHDQQALLIGPADSRDRVPVPRDLPDQLPGATVDVDRRLGGLSTAVGVDFGFIADES